LQVVVIKHGSPRARHSDVTMVEVSPAGRLTLYLPDREIDVDPRETDMVVIKEVNL